MCNDSRLPVSQYDSNSLLKRYIDTFNNQVCEAGDDIATMFDFFDLDKAVGVWLDIIGLIVGQPRLVFDGSNQNWFAMDSPDASLSGFNIGRFWDGTDYSVGNVPVDDIMYRNLIKARIINNRANATIDDVLKIVELLLGRTDCRVLDGGCNDSSSITPAKMEFALEFSNPVSNDERSLLLDLGLLPKTAGVLFSTILP